MRYEGMRVLVRYEGMRVLVLGYARVLVTGYEGISARV